MDTKLRRVWGLILLMYIYYELEKNICEIGNIDEKEIGRYHLIMGDFAKSNACKKYVKFVVQQKLRGI